MAFVIGTFVLVVSIVAGLYWVIIERPEAQQEGALRQRVRKGTVRSNVAKALAKDRERLSDMRFLDAALSRCGRLIDPFQLTITQSGLKVTVGVVILMCLCAGALMFAFVRMYLNLPLLAFVFGALAAYVPYGYIRWVRSR